jgi:hypothetical protein
LFASLTRCLYAKNVDGSAEGLEAHDSVTDELRALETALAMLLAKEDVESIGAALEPGSGAAGLVGRTRGPRRPVQMILIAGPANTSARPSADQRGRRGLPHSAPLTHIRRSPRPSAETSTIPPPARGCTASNPFAPGNAATAGEPNHNAPRPVAITTTAPINLTERTPKPERETSTEVAPPALLMRTTAMQACDADSGTPPIESAISQHTRLDGQESNGRSRRLSIAI